MHDWTNECGVSIGTQLIQEAGKGERVKLFLKFSLKVGVVKNLLLRPFQSKSILQGQCVLPRRMVIQNRHDIGVHTTCTRETLAYYMYYRSSVWWYKKR